MITEGQTDDAVALVIHLLSALREENVTLQERLRNALRQLYGRRSEKMDAKDRALLERLAGVGNDADKAAPSTPDAAKPAAEGSGASPKKPLPKGAGHGRGDKPTELPEKRTPSRVPEGERTCPKCGDALCPLKPVDCWQVEYVPGHFEVQTTEREQLSCRRCRDVIVTAPAPPKVLSGGEAGAGLLAKILVDKGEDHLPIERQQRRLAREGLTVPETTVAGWWSQAADLLMPMQEVLRREAMHSWLPQVDATGLDVLDRDHPKGLRVGTIWTAAGGRAVAFTYTPVKGQGLRELIKLRVEVGADGVRLTPQPVEAPAPSSQEPPPDPNDEKGEGDGEDEPGSETQKELQLPARGPFQCDGERLFEGLWRKLGFTMVLVHCWMHARRYFERAVKARDLRAAVAMKWIAEMYEIERRATAEGVSPEERARRRQAETWPLLERLREWALELAPLVPPSTPLGKALGYVQRRWLGLTVFVLDGRIPMDNGEVERWIRRIAVGRGNWLFTGSDAGARRLCVVASLCATCRKLGIDPWAYLRDALLAAGSGMSRLRFVEDFSPWAWAQKQAQKPDAQEALGGG